jgi:hypothetical protein
MRNVRYFSKQNEKFNFKLHKIFDISEIENKIRLFNSEWLIDTSRQNMYVPHKNTNTYFLIEHSNHWQYGDMYMPQFKCLDKELWESVKPIVKYLESIIDGKMGKVVLINLPSGKDILEHQDKGDYLDIVRRFHIPIITNENVWFKVEDEVKNMKAGECWEINNSKPHSVKNEGIENRIHLMIDIMA